MNKNYKAIEGIGLAILVVVLVAIHDIPEILWNNSKLHPVFLLMTAAVSVMALASVARIFGYMRYRILTLMGVTMLCIGGYVFYFVPDFFNTVLPVSMGFWLKVTAYSLPAICVEGGLLTLFTVFRETKLHITSGDRDWLQVGFPIYAIIAMSVNFAVILGFVEITHQILFSQIILTGTLIITMYITAHELLS